MALRLAHIPEKALQKNSAMVSSWHMLSNQQKKSVMDTVKAHDTDTGSPAVQIALLSERITELTEHLKVHKKDVHSRRGLIKMVDTRRKMLRNLKNNDFELYQGLVKQLGLKK